MIRSTAKGNAVGELKARTGSGTGKAEWHWLAGGSGHLLGLCINFSALQQGSPAWVSG